MDRRTKIIIGLFIIVLLAIIVTEVVRPKPVNWKESYTADDTIPFGCYVLYHELPSLFNGAKIEKVTESLYNTLSADTTSTGANYVMVNNEIELDEQELDQLLDFVKRGNDVFIAANYFGTYLSDTLNLDVQSAYNIEEDTVVASFTNNQLNQKTFGFKKGMYNQHFTSLDTLNTTILGHIAFTLNDFSFQEDDDPTDTETLKKKPNFIKVAFGDGYFYLNTTPLAFTNYYLLNGNQGYAVNALSYLKDFKSLYWDNYKKAGRIVISSPLRFILLQPALKWAYYLAVTGVLFLLVFKSKREQRIIPVIVPLENSSVEFAKTVGSLYYGHKDYTDIVFKKINYFLGFIRSKYLLETQSLNDRTATDLASKSGKTVTETKALIDFINILKNKTAHSGEDLIQLDKKITAFKN